MPGNMVNGFNVNGTPVLYNYDSLGNKLEKTSIAKEYSNTDTYNVDDYVIYNGKMYRCKREISVGESFDSTKWTECSIGPELNYIKKFVGFSEDAKYALLNLLAHVAYTDEHGQDYYDELETALMQKTLESITAVFVQGDNVIYDTDSLDDLKPMLTVTAHYDNGTSATVTTYTLSGALTEGTSIITVSYGGKTDTFNVNVTEYNPFEHATYERYPWARTGGTTATAEYIYKNNVTSARARLALPLANPNKTFTVTDQTKYNIVVYNVTSLETEVVPQGSGTTVAWPGTDNNKSWNVSDSSSAPYVALSFKKLDNTEFTDEELANMYGTVFTMS